MGWLAGWCVSLLGLVASVRGVARTELFPFGSSARDQLLEQGNDQTHQLSLDSPVLFYDGTFSSIFVSFHLNFSQTLHFHFFQGLPLTLTAFKWNGSIWFHL